MSNAGARPYIVRPGEGWMVNFMGGDFTVKVGEERHGRRVAVTEYAARQGEEPPDHIHSTEDEIFYVLEGALSFRCDGEEFDANAGALVFLPRGLEHGYTIRSDGEVRLLVITAPAPTDGTAGWGGFFGSVESRSSH